MIVVMMVFLVHTPYDDLLLKEIVENRKSIKNYHISCVIRGSITNLKIESTDQSQILEYTRDIDMVLINGKQYQLAKSKHTRPELDNHTSLCKGCTDDGDIYSKNFIHPQAVVYKIHPKASLAQFHSPTLIGFSSAPFEAYNFSTFDFLLKSQHYTSWTRRSDSTDSGLIVLTRSSIDGSATEMMEIDAVRKRIISTKFQEGKNVISVRNEYKGTGTFPSLVTVYRDTPNRTIKETIEVTKAEFGLPDSYFTFDSAKAGLRYNVSVSTVLDPDDKSSKPTSIRYWDGKKLVNIVPDPSEYNPNYKSPDAVPPPALVPVQEGGFPWRVVLLVVAGVMAVVAMVFAVRGARSRG
jgi:hypothetical protein